MLVGDVRVIACCCEFGGAALRAVEIIGAQVDIMEFDGAFDVRSYRLEIKYSQHLPLQSLPGREEKKGSLTCT